MPEGLLVPGFIIKAGFLVGGVQDIFPPWMGECPGFICKEGKQLLGAQAGSRQIPFSPKTSALSGSVLVGGAGNQPLV